MTVAAPAPSRTSRRCRSWRPVPASEHRPIHPPGDCRSCWRPCFRKVAAGRRCDECTAELSANLDPTVRRMLAAEPGVPTPVLRVLSGDLNAVVAAAAQWQLDRREPAPAAEHAEPGWSPGGHGPAAIAPDDDDWN